MPMNLVLVRHGESEGNVARQFSKNGDHSLYTAEFKNRHNSLLRLTDTGREQARIAGQWIRANIRRVFFRYYVSEYIRAKETAAYLGFLGAKWYADFYLRERDWGKLDLESDEVRKTRFAEDMKRKELDSFYWTPPDGESMAQICFRIDRVLDTLHRECDGEDVIIVCHGETMLGFRVRIERMSQEKYHANDCSKDPLNRIHNGQIIHYTRRDPATGEVAPYCRWMRSVCPWDPKRSRNEWEVIERPRYSNQDLLDSAAKLPRFIE
jgi:NAD+ kinase